MLPSHPSSREPRPHCLSWHTFHFLCAAQDSGQVGGLLVWDEIYVPLRWAKKGLTFSRDLVSSWILLHCSIPLFITISLPRLKPILKSTIVFNIPYFRIPKVDLQLSLSKFGPLEGFPPLLLLFPQPDILCGCPGPCSFHPHLSCSLVDLQVGSGGQAPPEGARAQTERYWRCTVGQGQQLTPVALARQGLL